MKLLLTTIAAVLVVGCGESQQSPTVEPAEPAVEAAKTEPPTAKAPETSIPIIPDISIDEDGDGVYAALEKFMGLSDNNADDKPTQAEVGLAELKMFKWSLQEGTSLLHVASTREIAELIIDEGEDVNVRDRNEKTPLHFAIDKELAELLLDKGADVNARDKKGMTPMHTIMENPMINPVMVMPLTPIQARDQMQTALLKSGGEIVELLIARGAEVDAKSNLKKTPLHLAAAEGNAGMVALLISKSANVNAMDDQGATPLHEAANMNGIDWVTAKLATIKIMIANGANVNAMDSQGRTPLDLVESAFIGVVEFHKATGQSSLQGIASIKAQANLLRKYGGKTGEELKDTKQVAESSGISIHDAAETGDIEAAKQAIANGADVNGKDKDSWTPLSLAALEGHKEVVEFLIAKGVDVNTKDEEGRTPLHLATREDYKEVAELLIVKGADVNAENVDGDTPLDLADGETADLLRKHGGKTGEELKAEGK